MPASLLSRTAQRLAVTITAVAATLGASTTVADAAVYSSCTQTRCSDARSADTTWQSMGYPGTRGWYDWPGGKCNYAGGTYSNREGELPAGHSYREFDVYPRTCGAARDAYRIIVDLTTGVVWFSPNHYTDFYEI
ncbi:ribonuclease domain-containing protein [Amycolatopsis sp. NPDC051102]|uniref:ribonuclease domain-containing protein n=1 Tax=Amycolatopsis sp. NPDC051102 TaxID=3155163 RepID=UPI0034341D4B